jgi:hypothetical protein
MLLVVRRHQLTGAAARADVFALVVAQIGQHEITLKNRVEAVAAQAGSTVATKSRYLADEGVHRPVRLLQSDCPEAATHPMVFLKPSSRTPAKSTAALILSSGSADGLGSDVSTSAKGLRGGRCGASTAPRFGECRCALQTPQPQYYAWQMQHLVNAG